MRRITLSDVAQRLTFGLVLGAVVLLACPQSQAAIVTLTDNNSTAQIDTDSQAGMFNWTVQGIPVIRQQWFWFRVGSTAAEQSVNTISASVVAQPNARTMSTTYQNAQMNLRIDYLLSGGAVVPTGTAVSDVAETITITNRLTTALDLHFFQYSNFDLAVADTVRLGTNLGGLFNEALQTGTNGSISETVNSPGANHGETAFTPFTLNRLNDGVATTLNDNAGPTGPGDVTWALQWDFVINPGASVIISKDKRIQVNVPEPATAGMLAIGIFGFALRRRSR